MRTRALLLSLLAAAAIAPAQQARAEAAPSDDGQNYTSTVVPGVSPKSRRYADVKGFLYTLAQRYPQNVRVVQIGTSDSGETIIGIAAGDPRASLKNVVVGTHHGNEYGATEVALGFAEHIAANPISGQIVYVIPVLNVGGYDIRQREERASNGRSYDPNRNYPGPCGTEGPFTLKSTKNLANFIARENIVASATLHTAWPAVLYPWGLPATDLKTLYDREYQDLSRSAVVASNYQIGNSTELLYAALGAYEDYAYWAHGIWSLLFELGYSHYPSDSDVERMIAINVPGIRRMMETAPKQRAERHSLESSCDAIRASFDRHDE